MKQARKAVQDAVIELLRKKKGRSTKGNANL